MKSIQFVNFRNKISEWIEKSAIKSWVWYYWLFFYGIIPAFILAIPLIKKFTLSLVGPQTPPLDFVNQTFILNMNNPTFLSMFLANYTHIEITHLCSNLLFYFLSISIIFLIEKNKKTFVNTSVLFLTILPFFISIISILFFSTIKANNPIGYGFSGIVLAFLGYSMYLICKVVCETDINLEPNLWNNYTSAQKMRYFGFLIWYNLFFLLSIPILAIAAGGFIFSGGSLGNGIAHFGGYIFGLLIPICSTILQNRQIKNFEMTLLIQIIFTLGFYGIYLIFITR